MFCKPVAVKCNSFSGQEKIVPNRYISVYRQYSFDH